MVNSAGPLQVRVTSDYFFSNSRRLLIVRADDLSSLAFLDRAMASGFAALRVASHLTARLARRGITRPTPVQLAALGVLMPHEGRTSSRSKPPPRHSVIRWPTGSGKTLAFALPLVARVDVTKAGSGCQALVVSPTRELVLQTGHTLKLLAGLGKKNKKGRKLKVATLLGHAKQRLTTELVHHPPDIAVGSPHTLAALLESGELPLTRDRQARTLVLDEVGALINQQRWPEVQRVLRGVKLRQEDGKNSHERRAAARQAGRIGAWADGSTWLVSADVPGRAIKRCLSEVKASGRSGSDPDAMQFSLRHYTAYQRHDAHVAASSRAKADEVVLISPTQRMPHSVRHVAVWPQQVELPALLSSLVTRSLSLDPPVSNQADVDASEGVGASEAGVLEASALEAEWLAEGVLDVAHEEAEAAYAKETGESEADREDAAYATWEGSEDTAEAYAEDAGSGAHIERVDGMSVGPTVARDEVGMPCGDAASRAEEANEQPELAETSPVATASSTGTDAPSTGPSKPPKFAALVFARSSASADGLARNMRGRHVRADVIHTADGDGTPQGRAQRRLKLRRFAKGELRVLAATDMLAYGVDVRGASHVVNERIPQSSELYLHRAGRVGRVGGLPGARRCAPGTHQIAPSMQLLCQPFAQLPCPSHACHPTTHSGTVISLPRTRQELEELRRFSSELGFTLEVLESVDLRIRAAEERRASRAQDGPHG